MSAETPLTTLSSAGVEFRFESSEPDVIVDHETRVAQGLDHWVDGTLGILRDGTDTQVISPNGIGCALHRISSKGWGVPVKTGVAIEGTQSDHASGGPVYFDRETGILVLFYHGENFTNGDPQDYYSYIGSAVSNDRGISWQDLGPVLTSSVSQDDPYRPRPVEVGPGSYVVHGEWIYLYYQDRGNGPVRRRLGVARCRIANFVGSAQKQEPPIFSKYFDGGWGEAGLGGQSTELLDIPWLVWFDTATFADSQHHLVIYSSSWLDGRQPHWMYYAAVSPDGLHWSSPTPILKETVTDEVIYLSIDSGGQNQRLIEGSSFDIYRTRSTAQYRWDDAWLERITVDFEVNLR